MPSSFPPPPPHARIAALAQQKEALEKKHAGLAQYQYLCWFPVWIPLITNAVRPTPTVPGREIYVLWFHIGSFVFSLVSWVALRIYLGKLKKQIAALDAQITPPTDRPKPPISSPL